ncbi:uncharacterized protein LOC132256587 [Phlebotomus argentipes]|uniref:uncharacterized protein LOC132256587 n=1 Tax=Phlebotomus argentipes TaxID=94469 RepID=UPI002892E0D4|nr:uncharacterized protein LOC132256587 [Phlebotomus argentipes]
MKSIFHTVFLALLSLTLAQEELMKCTESRRAFANPKDCTTYYECSLDEPEEPKLKHCVPGKVFNPERNLCDQRENVDLHACTDPQLTTTEAAMKSEKSENHSAEPEGSQEATQAAAEPQHAPPETTTTTTTKRPNESTRHTNYPGNQGNHRRRDGVIGNMANVVRKSYGLLGNIANGFFSLF